MAKTQRGDISKQVKRIYRLYDLGRLDEAKRLAIQVEADCTAIEDDLKRAIHHTHIATCLVDIGGAVGDETMVDRGTVYFREWVEKHATDAAEDEWTQDLYNLGNGYFGLWTFRRARYMGDGVDGEEHRLARRYYRQAIESAQFRPSTNHLACQIWTNYGNALSHVSRSIEAVDAYDMALKINPLMGMALGNKAIAISHLAPLMHGHTHVFYLEAIRLLEIAMAQPLTSEGRSGFNTRLEQLKYILSEHEEMKPEEIQGIKPSTAFHRFLCEFCARHGLFLNPATLLGEDGRAFYGDPMFISTMYAGLDDRNKFERYVTFLNEIKQDYVLGRFFLVQSQYQTPDIDALDEGVSLFYPLDYSLYSTYIQLLKTANKQAIAVLDKIAYFIYDYCGLKTPDSGRVTFRQLWGGNEKMRSDLNSLTSPYLFALFNLSQDVSKKGDWGHIYEHRDASTHRFLVIHDMQLSSQANKDIPRVDESKFINDTILAFKIARAAFVYLVLFVEHQEHSRVSMLKRRAAPIIGTPIDGVLRHRPSKRV